MLVETPNPVVLAWWRWYCRYALRKHFHRVMLYGDLARPATEPTAEPGAAATLYLADHLSWWDGVLLFHLLGTRLGERGLRCMVDETQVRKHPFFRRVGCFSVDRTRPRDGLRAVRHAADLLERGHSVVVFPQGRIRPADAPVSLERGFTYLLDFFPAARVRVLTFRYDFWEHQRPELLAWSSPTLAGNAAGLDDIADTFRAGVETLRDASLRRAEGDLLLRCRRSIAELPTLVRRRK